MIRKTRSAYSHLAAFVPRAEGMKREVEVTAALPDADKSLADIVAQVDAAAQAAAAFVEKNRAADEAMGDLRFRTEAAYSTGVRLVEYLRNPAYTVFTGPPPEGSVKSVNMAHYTSKLPTEVARLTQSKEASAGAFESTHPELVTSLDGYAASAPVIAAAIQAVVDAHGGRTEPMTDQERSGLAAIYEAELEP